MIEIDDVLQQLNELKRIRQDWESTWKDVTDLVIPRRSFWDLEDREGQEPAVKVFDTTAIEAANLVVDGLQGYLISQNSPWFRLTLSDRLLMRENGVADWLELVEMIMYDEFAASSFYQETNELLSDGVSVGTGAMLIDDDPTENRIVYSTRHPKEYYIAENRFGRVDTFYREYYMRNRQVVKAWPDTVSKKREQEAESNPFGKVRIIHVVQPREDRRPWMRDKFNKAYASMYIDAESNNGEPLEEGGYDEFPYVVWRWRKNSDELYGRSPAIDALADVRRLNAMSETMVKAGQFAVEPPLNVPMKMKGTERIVPRGLNYYSSGEMIQPINLGQNYPIGLDQVRDVKEQVREMFRTKIFLLMEQMQNQRGQMTATEVRERMGEKAAVLGAIIGRLNAEFLVPQIRRTFNILERRGSIPAPPPVLAQRGGMVHIDFVGPLAQAQKRYHQSAGVISGLAFIEPVLKMNPKAADNVNFDELIRSGMDTNGMPQRVIREMSEVEKIRDARQKAEAEAARQQQQAQEAAMLTQNADKLNQRVQPGSMLEGAGRAAQQQQAQEAANA